MQLKQISAFFDHRNSLAQFYEYLVLIYISFFEHPNAGKSRLGVNSGGLSLYLVMVFCIFL